MLRAEDLEAERPAWADENVHFTESLAQAVIEEFSAPGATVLDPFAGYGTTLVVAERMGRAAVGVEIIPEKVELIRQRLRGTARIVHGDSRQLAAFVGGPVDLCLTSPPYMAAVDHEENPLTGYQSTDGDYPVYLRQIGSVFEQVARLLRPGGHAVLNVANLVTNGTFTPLAWDVARSVSRHLTLRGESFLCWDTQPPEISGDYLLHFQRTR
jgi:DNA modification methylase